LPVSESPTKRSLFRKLMLRPAPPVAQKL